MRRLVSLILSILMLFSLCTMCLGEGTQAPNDKEETEEVIYHHFVKWHWHGNGTHLSVCDFDDCNYVRVVPCSSLTVEHDGKTLTFCPICGHYTGGRGNSVWNRVWQTWDYSSSPKGDFSTILYTRPFGGESSVLFCASLVFRYDGAPTYFDGYTTFMFGLSGPNRAAYTQASEINAYLTNGEETIPVETEYIPSLYALQLTIPAGSWMLVVEGK
ncbi:MAG: hypothetical protein IKY06_07695 [Clostridia bacterium]|nr:hypothetical protein [Clostridia bacterium]